MLLLSKMEKEDFEMALKYKIDIMAELKKNGYTSTRIREVNWTILSSTDKTQ